MGRCRPHGQGCVGHAARDHNPAAGLDRLGDFQRAQVHIGTLQSINHAAQRLPGFEVIQGNPRLKPLANVRQDIVSSHDPDRLIAQSRGRQRSPRTAWHTRARSDRRRS